MEVNGKLQYTPDLPSRWGVGTLCQLNRGMGGPQKRSGRFGEDYSNPEQPSPLLSYYILCAISVA